MELFIALAATQIATTYGYHERNCGDVGKPVACDDRAVTATGERFKPTEITAAVPAPKKNRIYTTIIYVKDYKGDCIPLKINDKKNPRYIGKSGLDLTPAAVWAITGKLPTPYWSGRIELCKARGLRCSSTLSRCLEVTL